MRHRPTTWTVVIAAVAVSAVALRAQTPPARGGGAGQGAAQTPPPPPRGGGGLLGGMGPSDKPVVDAASADRGRKVWAAECINCHGSQARGTNDGPNLVRSELVLHDRYGTQLGPYLKKGHKTQSGTPSANFSQDQIVDLANFLRQRITDTIRGSPIFVPGDILTGDAKAGAAYFNGEGKCATCHSPTGDLAGVGGRLDAINVQQRFLFPGVRGRGAGPSRSAVIVTVTPASGQPVSGVVVQMDDFNVTLRDSSGAQRTFTRTPALKVVKTDPLAAHHALLDTITDKQIHDVVAYLVTLK